MLKTRATLSLALACLLSLAPLAGCASAPPARDDAGESAPARTASASATDAAKSDAPPITLHPVASEAKALQSPAYQEDTEAKAVAQGANAFALQFSAALLREEKAADAAPENFLCSPFSAWLPLAALAEATDEKDKPALLDALGAAGVREEDMHRAASRMLFDLTNSQDEQMAARETVPAHNPLSIVNALFVQPGMPPKKAFAQTFLDAYRGETFPLDFRSPRAAEAVNQWASESTDGLITDVVQAFDPDTVAAIANAIYFSDRWDREFDPEKTVEGDFHALSGDTRAHYMLREGDMLPYYEDAQMQAMPLSFKTGGALYILLPKDGDAIKLLSSLTQPRFAEIQRNIDRQTGKLLLPRFSIDGESISLKAALTAMGVPLFDRDRNPLSALLEEPTPVWLSGAVQKSAIRVDEKGTTAAAVTVMTKAGSAMPQATEPFEINCNRPFAFILTNRTYDGGDQILFTGIVQRPQ